MFRCKLIVHDLERIKIFPTWSQEKQCLLSLLQDSIELVTSVLQHLLKTVTLIGFIILVFGQPYSYLALDLYGGSLLSSGAGMYFIICSIKIHAS